MCNSSDSSASTGSLELLLRRTIDESIGETAVGVKRTVSLQSFWALIAKGLKAAGVDQSAFEPAVAAVETLFDQYVAPYDIPAIPNFIEPMVDAALRRQIRPVIQHFFDALTVGS